MEGGRERGLRQGSTSPPDPCLNAAGSGPFLVNGRVMFAGGITHLSCRAVGRRREREWQVVLDNQLAHLALL